MRISFNSIVQTNSTFTEATLRSVDMVINNRLERITRNCSHQLVVCVFQAERSGVQGLPADQAAGISRLIAFRQKRSPTVVETEPDMKPCREKKEKQLQSLSSHQ